jgi:hypothetical protein
MESISQVLAELQDVDGLQTSEGFRRLVTTLWRRTAPQIAELSIQFAEAEMKNVAAMCRSIALAKGRGNRQ